MGVMRVMGVMLALLAARAIAEDTVSVDPGTEEVIHGALEYLAKQQQANGSWTQSPGSAKRGGGDNRLCADGVSEHRQPPGRR